MYRPIFLFIPVAYIQKDKAKDCSSEKEVRGDHCTRLRTLSGFIGTSSASVCVCVLNKRVLLTSTLFSSSLPGDKDTILLRRRKEGGAEERGAEEKDSGTFQII